MSEPIASAASSAVSTSRASTFRGRAVVEWAARAIVVIPALLFTGTYLVCAALRWTFPWEIEWMEGGMIMHAARVLRGLPIYARPSLDFVAFFYTPVYPFVLAVLSHVTGGLSFALARGVSIVASLATMGMLFYAARRERGLLAGVLAVGFYAALFRTSGAFYDLARADSLSLSFALAASLIAYYERSYVGCLLAAILVVLAFFTKQTSGLTGAFIGLYLLKQHVRHALAYGGLGVALGLATTLWLERASDGWFLFYTVSGHGHHAFSTRHFVLEYWQDILFLCPFIGLLPTLGASYGRITRWLALPAVGLWVVAFCLRMRALDHRLSSFYHELWYQPPRIQLLVPPLVIAALLLVVRSYRPRSQLRPPAGYFLLLCLGAVLASDLNHSTQWAYSNCFMPIAVFASLYSAMLVAPLLEPTIFRSAGDLVSAGACSTALLVQFIALGYDPRAQTPSAADRAAVRELVATLDRFPAPVLIPAHPLYSYLRDGTIHTHAMGFSDVVYAGGLDRTPQRIAKGEFPTVVVDTRARPLPRLKAHYRHVHAFTFEGRTLFPRTGYSVRPADVFVHRKVPTDP